MPFSFYSYRGETWTWLDKLCSKANYHSRFDPSCTVGLGFYFVLSFEHIINFRQVVGPFGYILRVALWRVTFLQMCLFSKYAHLAYHQQGRTHAPNDVALTSSYVSGGTVLLASNLLCKSRCLAMELMSPTTFMLKNELASPLP